MSNPIIPTTVLVQITVRNPITDELAAATVDLVIQEPDGTESTEMPDNPSLGVYEYYLPLTEPGWWTAVWTATSGNFVKTKTCSICAEASGLALVSP